LNEGERGAAAPRRLSGRGLAFWQRGRDKRVLYVTPGYRLVALNADTGRPIETFGEHGIVDLWETLDQGDDWDTSQIGTHSPPTIANDVVIVPAAHTPLAPPDRANNVAGYIRGFDVVTGKHLWTFHTVPRRGEPGYESWPRRLGRDRRRQRGRLGHDLGRRDARARVFARRIAVWRYVRRLAARREPLRREHRRRGHRDRRATLAFSDVASSALGL
jgi:hypothetical protein